MVSCINNQGRLVNTEILGLMRTDYGYDWVSLRTSHTDVSSFADQLTSYQAIRLTDYLRKAMVLSC